MSVSFEVHRVTAKARSTVWEKVPPTASRATTRREPNPSVPAVAGTAKATR
jgi:hypothetical protein